MGVSFTTTLLTQGSVIAANAMVRHKCDGRVRRCQSLYSGVSMGVSMSVIDIVPRCVILTVWFLGRFYTVRHVDSHGSSKSRNGASLTSAQVASLKQMVSHICDAGVGHGVMVY